MSLPSEPMLTGKSVVVTGSGGGIGAAYARLAASHGAAVVVNDVDAGAAESVAEEIRRAGGRAVAFAADVSDWDAAGNLVATAVETFGRIDGLVNNAGLFTAGEPDDLTAEQVDRLVRVNVVGSVACGTHAIGFMKRQRSGVVVNVTSGVQCGTRGLSLYGMTKGAMASLTYGWALDLAEFGVRVNAISPNAHTRMADEYERFRGDASTGQNVGKSPETNAPAAVFLLSDASAPLTGQVLRVDGADLTLMTHPRQVVPVAREDGWTVRSVAAAMAGPLASYAQPLGLADHVLTER